MHSGCKSGDEVLILEIPFFRWSFQTLDKDGSFMRGRARRLEAVTLFANKVWTAVTLPIAARLFRREGETLLKGDSLCFPFSIVFTGKGYTMQRVVM